MEFEERYFREELDYLRQLSKLLATEKPHLARFLAEKDADPDIERLLEGVAFLTGNLRQKIEDEFPELTHGLIKMLWPNYLRPVPAMTLIEYTPDTGSSAEHSGPGFYRYPARWHILSAPADGTTVAESGKSHSNIRPNTVAPGR
ncbi:type VI secretion protein [Escherichia coli]|nr:type VI secretion protein [Escherichia coli]